MGGRWMKNCTLNALESGHGLHGHGLGHLRDMADSIRYLSMNTVQQTYSGKLFAPEDTDRIVDNMFDIIMQLDALVETIDVPASMFDDLMQLDTADLH